MKSFAISLSVLLLCLVQSSAALSYDFVVSEFATLFRGYRFEMKAVDVNDFVLTIRCEDCNRYAVTYNSASIMAMGNRWNTDTCYREFCVKSLPPPADFDFKAVSKKDWVDGISFRVRLPFRTRAKLSLYTRPVLRANILPTFLVSRKYGKPQDLEFQSDGQFVHIEVYSPDTKRSPITVNDYPLWVVEAAKIALEKYKFVFPEEISTEEGLKALFQFAAKYDLIAVQKVILSKIVLEVSPNRLYELLPALSIFKEDRFGLIHKLIKMLSAHYCQNMDTMNLAKFIKDPQLELSCDV